jgi:hypothetical protein
MMIGIFVMGVLCGLALGGGIMMWQLDRKAGKPII